MELKESSAFTKGTKRRRTQTQLQYGADALSTRLTRLTRKVKLQNPVHLAPISLNTAFSTVSTTGSIYDLASGIAQGDDYDDRFSSQIYMRRVNVKGVLLPGSAAGNPAIARITIFRAESGLVFGANMTGSYSPIVTGVSLQVYYDRFFTLGTYTNIGFPVNLNFSVKLKHKQKFSGTGAATASGHSIYMIVQSGVAAGTAAPSISGVMEIFFDPM